MECPLNGEFQQRKLPRDAGEWPAARSLTARWFIEKARGEIVALSNK
jgi:hypothetical protein